MVGVGAPGGGDRFGGEQRGEGGAEAARGGGSGGRAVVAAAPLGMGGGGGRGGGVGCASALGICQGRRETRLLFLIKEPAFIEG